MFSGSSSMICRMSRVIPLAILEIGTSFRASVQSINPGGGDDRIEWPVVGFGRQGLASLRVPCQANGEHGGMFREPTVIMPAALPETSEIRREADQRDEQYVRHQRLGIGGRLEDAEGTDFEIVLRVRISVVAEGHRRTAIREMGKGEGMAGIAEEARIGGRGRLERAGVVKPDSRLLRCARKERRRGTMEHECAQVIGQRIDMGLARGEQRAAEVGF